MNGEDLSYAGDTAERPEELRDIRTPPRDIPPLTRKRLIELIAIAEELCGWLESKGVKKEEGCHIRGATEQLWNLK